MANAYTSKANGWKIPSLLQNESTMQHLKVFIDDVNLFIRQPEHMTEEEFVTKAQTDINCWHGILQATGGKLNAKKCFWSDFHLQYDSNGTPSIRAKTDDDPKLYLTNLDGTQTILKMTQPDEGIRHLGVHISMDAIIRLKPKYCTSTAKYSSRFIPIALLPNERLPWHIAQSTFQQSCTHSQPQH